MQLERRATALTSRRSSSMHSYPFLVGSRQQFLLAFRYLNNFFFNFLIISFCYYQFLFTSCHYLKLFFSFLIRSFCYYQFFMHKLLPVFHYLNWFFQFLDQKYLLLLVFMHKSVFESVFRFLDLKLLLLLVFHAQLACWFLDRLMICAIMFIQLVFQRALNQSSCPLC